MNAQPVAYFLQVQLSANGPQQQNQTAKELRDRKEQQGRHPGPFCALGNNKTGNEADTQTNNLINITFPIPLFSRIIQILLSTLHSPFLFFPE